LRRILRRKVAIGIGEGIGERELRMMLLGRWWSGSEGLRGRSRRERVLAGETMNFE
jgi:hypothetical protein